MGGGGGIGGALGQIGGALTGTMLGGPIGTVLGAQAGGALGGAIDGVKYNGVEAANPALINPANAMQAQTAYDASQNALKQQQAFVQALQAQNGIGNQNQAAQMALNQAQGVGPNPALAQLNQSTAANTANQAALMAGQRGAAANPALIARQASMQGAQNQQNAAGQAATLAAQQQLAGQQQFANIAGNQVANQMGATQNYGNAAMGQQQIINNAIAGQNANALGLAGQQNEIGLKNREAGNQLLGNVLGAAGSVLAMAEGGSIPAQVPKAEGPRSSVGKHFHMMAKGGKVPALVSPGERYLKPEQVEKVADGKANPMKAGEKIPGKPVVDGAKNSYANDTVPKQLDEGGIVIPRSITQSKDAEKKSMEFVKAILAKNGKGLSK